MKLGIGTAEFGSNYGTIRRRIRPSEVEVSRILRRAQQAGVRLIDTAPAYGRSEGILGRCVPRPHSFRIVTKTPVFRTSRITRPDGEALKESFFRSLRRLGETSVYGLLIHHAPDLLSRGGERLFGEMAQLRDGGFVRKIGASVYERQEAEALTDRYPIDIIQFPVNALDQRFVGGEFLGRLKKRGVEIHGRSLFLQGVLLIDCKRIPLKLDRLRALLEKFRSFCRLQGWSALQAALYFAMARRELDRIVVGVNTLGELDQILRLAKKRPRRSADWSPFAARDAGAVDPRTWTAAMKASS